MQTAIQQMTELEKLKSHTEMTVTTEGLRIELSESASGTLFDTGSAKVKPTARCCWDFGTRTGYSPNKLSIERHPDSQP